MVKAISARGGLFTTDQANGMLPLIRRIVNDWMRLNAVVASQRHQREGLEQLRQTVGQKAYSDELADVEASLRAQHEQLDACRRELESLGVELHSPCDGSIDFPAVMQGREVRLCWRAGEATVDYWHDLGEPPSERRRIQIPAQRSIR